MDIEKILKTARTIAVVGCSRDPAKDAHCIPAYLQGHGYRIIPVNPGAMVILGERCYPSLKDIPGAIDIVDIFRPGSEVMGIVREAVALQPKPKAIWTQLGIRDDAAKQLAEAHGIAFVQDRCIMAEHQKLVR
ncbi:MAG: CoA-binding protein [Candidatus Aenigmarchaeota archaeon]|nr:CoA-binding protein [Candidatus Aenigmarchaeota archaeon]